ncbi:MAG: T9SS type A sorting domain-containing protein [Bacteroidota bacterium]
MNLRLPKHLSFAKTLSLAIFVLLVTGATFVAYSWGWDAHRFINRKTVYHLPNQMLLFIQDSAFFSLHSVDADQRRISGDTSFYAEAPRHFMDIDDYPNFHFLPRSLDSMILLYGWERVKENGINPWATVWNYDSLVNQLSRGDWSKAKLTASDIGHYVGDAHQPLHNTRNYNGQYSNNYGIHSRYETTMLNSTYYLNSLFITPDSVEYVADRINFVFDYILHTNSRVDTVLQADTYAKGVSGWNGSGTAPASYYNALWQRTRNITLDQMQRGTLNLASLWYSAWVDAGLITSIDPPPTMVADFRLHQNFPNPFNPATRISYDLPVGGTVSLKVFTLGGQEVATLAQGNQSAGAHVVEFNAGNLASGVYFYRLQLGSFTQTKKLTLMR